MTAAVREAGASARTGLRAIEPRRDMRAVAEIIGVAFADSLDEGARRMVQGMRLLGGLSWLGWLLSRILLPPAANPQGFVWEEQGAVVANASLLPVTGYPKRWVMANVAVLPRCRRQGIAHRLVEACIEHAARMGAEELVLQVDEDNAAACGLYASFGFKRMSVRTTWVRPAGASRIPMAGHGRCRPRREGEWREQWRLAQRVHPEGVLWPYPSTVSLFRPGSAGSWFRLEGRKHWVWVEEGRVKGSLSARPTGERAAWRLVLVVDPAWQGRAEADLLQCALHALAHGSVRFVLDYPQGVAVEALRVLQFEPRRTLAWMRRALGPLDAGQADRRRREGSA